MDDSLYFSEQHLAVRNMVREFARSEVAPVAAELDVGQLIPEERVNIVVPRYGFVRDIAVPENVVSGERDALVAGVAFLEGRDIFLLCVLHQGTPNGV